MVLRCEGNSDEFELLVVKGSCGLGLFLYKVRKTEGLWGGDVQ